MLLNLNNSVCRNLDNFIRFNVIIMPYGYIA